MGNLLFPDVVASVSSSAGRSGYYSVKLLEIAPANQLLDQRVFQLLISETVCQRSPFKPALTHSNFSFMISVKGEPFVAANEEC